MQRCRDAPGPPHRGGRARGPPAGRSEPPEGAGRSPPPAAGDEEPSAIFPRPPKHGGAGPTRRGSEGGAAAASRHWGPGELRPPSSAAPRPAEPHPRGSQTAARPRPGTAPHSPAHRFPSSRGGCCGGPEPSWALPHARRAAGHGLMPGRGSEGAAPLPPVPTRSRCGGKREGKSGAAARAPGAGPERFSLSGAFFLRHQLLPGGGGGPAWARAGAGPGPARSAPPRPGTGRTRGGWADVRPGLGRAGVAGPGWAAGAPCSGLGGAGETARREAAAAAAPRAPGGGGAAASGGAPWARWRRRQRLPHPAQRGGGSATRARRWRAARVPARGCRSRPAAPCVRVRGGDGGEGTDEGCEGHTQHTHGQRRGGAREACSASVGRARALHCGPRRRARAGARMMTSGR